MPALLKLVLLSTALHWLLARADITRPFWSRAARWSWLDALLRCPACSGFWLGLALWLYGVRPGNVLETALYSLLLTPVMEAVLIWGLQGSAIDAGPSAPSSSLGS